ncbi:hypothetical protein FRC01_003132 [Tulasnella sp. 417]|nr:hypothetical protein FRC01_003132 [Tulasnella sp. 417]
MAGNLSWNTNDETLRNAFSQWGNVIDSIIMRDRETGRSRGFGFVTYSTAEEANAAINSMGEQELDGRRMKINLANTPSGGSYSGGGGYNQGGYNQGYNQGGSTQAEAASIQAVSTQAKAASAQAAATQAALEAASFGVF